jgi:ABC-type phosphate transport system auxiliary subunit
MTLALVAGFWFAFRAGPAIERLLFAGDLLEWLDHRRGTGFGGWIVLLLPISATVVALGFARTVDPWLRRASLTWERGRCARVDLLSSWPVPSSASASRGPEHGSSTGCGSIRAEASSTPTSSATRWSSASSWDSRSSRSSTRSPRTLSSSVPRTCASRRSARRDAVADRRAHRHPDGRERTLLGDHGRLGRAVGETMIVLMATGNTPVMSWNIFNGFRTLSANIAVELPEAVRNSTHYRTLFLAALCLFAITFFFNTIAETVRQRFRREGLPAVTASLQTAPVAAAVMRAAPRRLLRRATSLSAQGEPMLWLTGGALVLALAMIAGLLVLVTWHGIVDVLAAAYPPSREGRRRRCSARSRRTRRTSREGTRTPVRRRELRTGNFEISGSHFQWISRRGASESRPEWALVVERTNWGRFFGFPAAFEVDGKSVATDPERILEAFDAEHPAARERFERAARARDGRDRRAEPRMESARLATRAVELSHPGDAESSRKPPPRRRGARRARGQLPARSNRDRGAQRRERAARDRPDDGDGQTKKIPLAEIVAIVPANRLSAWQRSRLRLAVEGVPPGSPARGEQRRRRLPAIFGTVAMTMIMSLSSCPSACSPRSTCASTRAGIPRQHRAHLREQPRRRAERRVRRLRPGLLLLPRRRVDRPAPLPERLRTRRTARAGSSGRR